MEVVQNVVEAENLVAVVVTDVAEAFECDVVAARNSRKAKAFDKKSTKKKADLR